MTTTNAARLAAVITLALMFAAAAALVGAR